ncbi:MAG: hypothetical protein JW986_08560 [Methanotrichaceae archaeon]|nr:hypothetical protein [Methanotrichaceae archaeon]
MADTCQEQVDVTIMAPAGICVETANCRTPSPLPARGRLGLGAVAKPGAIAARGGALVVAGGDSRRAGDAKGPSMGSWAE